MMFLNHQKTHCTTHTAELGVCLCPHRMAQLLFTLCSSSTSAMHNIIASERSGVLVREIYAHCEISI